MALTFNDENFEQEVLKSDIPVLVDFYADWCGPCKMMGPVVEKLADAYNGKVKVGKLNVDNSMETAGKYRVMSIPTFIIFKDGQPVDTIQGAVPKEMIESKLNAL
ncbi:thioredoxin [Diplocloster hominis]|uniref:thioredoxin n=1 Tax=Diplocloster hominis TaxID=3079010 RepID=UPI0031BB4113